MFNAHTDLPGFSCQLCLVPVLIVKMTNDSKSISAGKNTNSSNKTSTITSSNNSNIHNTISNKCDDDSNNGKKHNNTNNSNNTRNRNRDSINNRNSDNNSNNDNNVVLICSKGDTIKSDTSKEHHGSDRSVSNSTINPSANTNNNKL